MASLQDLFISKVRVKLLQIFLSEPEEIFYVRQLVRKAGEEINAVRRELAHMEAGGMLKREPRANRVYYAFRKDYLFRDELLRLVVKTTGLGEEIIKNKNKIGKLKYVMFSGPINKEKKRRKKEKVDFLIIGEVVLPQIAAIVRVYERKIGREINYTVMTQEEFEFRKKRRDPFINSILLRPRIMLIGDEEEMLSGGQDYEPARHEDRK